MFLLCLHLFQHRRSSSSRHKGRSRLHRIDRDAAAARQVPGRRYATQYHMIYLPNPASSYEWYYFSSETGRRRSRPNARARPRGRLLLVRTASPGSSPRRSPRVLHRRRAGAGRRGLLVFAPFLSFVLLGAFFEAVFWSSQPGGVLNRYMRLLDDGSISQRARYRPARRQNRASVL